MVSTAETQRVLRGGGARLDAAEWGALINFFLQYRETTDVEYDVALRRLSEQLAKQAAVRGTPRQGTQLRSPAGLKRRITVLRALERGDGRGTPIEARAAWALRGAEWEAHAPATRRPPGDFSLP